MTVHVLASEPHFARHLAPVWRGLPDGMKGTFSAPPSMHAELEQAGVDRLVWRLPPRRQPVIVASWGDLKRVRGRPTVLFEHGAGQTYTDRPTHPSYAGGSGRHDVGLFVCQSARVATINQRVWPGRRYAVVGTPYLDRWHTRAPRPPGERPTVVVSWHWDASVSPEARWAWPHYADHRWLHQLAERYEVFGHSHPRAAPRLAPWWAAAGVPVLDRFDQVLDVADCYVVDNSSTLYEAASTGIRTVALNAPWYRRHVHHGLRFWDLVPGPQADTPDQVADAVNETLAGGWDRWAGQVADVVYAGRDGSATRNAVRCIVDWVTDGAPVPARRTAVSDRPYDPFAPVRRSGGPGPVFAEPQPAVRRGGDVEVAGADTDGDGNAAVPENATDAVKWITDAEDSDVEQARARLVWAAELRRGGEPRKTVQRRVAAALDDVPDPHEQDTTGDSGDGDGDEPAGQDGNGGDIEPDTDVADDD